MSQKSERVSEGAVATVHARRPGRVLKKLRLHSLGIPQELGVGWGKKMFVGVLKIFGEETGGGGGMVNISEGRKGPGMQN